MDLVFAAWKRIWNSFFLLVLCGRLLRSNIRFPTSTEPYSTRYNQGDSGLGRQLADADALSILHKLPSAKLQELLPDTISAVLADDFLWRHDEIQRQLNKRVVKDHDYLYDLSRIPDQQDKATLLSTDTSIFQLIPILKV